MPYLWLIVFAYSSCLSTHRLPLKAALGTELESRMEIVRMSVISLGLSIISASLCCLFRSRLVVWLFWVAITTESEGHMAVVRVSVISLGLFFISVSLDKGAGPDMR
jgi:hypothetical protein